MIPEHFFVHLLQTRRYLQHALCLFFTPETLLLTLAVASDRFVQLPEALLLLLILHPHQIVHFLEDTISYFCPYILT